MKTIPLEIQEMNNFLLRDYGRHDNGEANFRISWSDDQYEYRYGSYDKYSDSGIWTGQETGVKFVPKYKQWLPSQWVLERLLPTEGNEELVEKLSYEPFFPFRHLPPDYDVCKIIIDSTLEKQHGPKGIAKYHIPESELGTKEAIEERVRKMEKYLFEDESNLQARLHFREAVTVPDMNLSNKMTEN
jgi:hypothetical protein